MSHQIYKIVFNEQGTPISFTSVVNGHDQHKKSILELLKNCYICVAPRWGWIILQRVLQDQS